MYPSTTNAGRALAVSSKNPTRFQGVDEPLEEGSTVRRKTTGLLQSGTEVPRRVRRRLRWQVDVEGRGRSDPVPSGFLVDALFERTKQSEPYFPGEMHIGRMQSRV